jgi:hypothetical protein
MSDRLTTQALPSDKVLALGTRVTLNVMKVVGCAYLLVFDQMFSQVPAETGRRHSTRHLFQDGRPPGEVC